MSFFCFGDQNSQRSDSQQGQDSHQKERGSPAEFIYDQRQGRYAQQGTAGPAILKKSDCQSTMPVWHLLTDIGLQGRVKNAFSQARQKQCHQNDRVNWKKTGNQQSHCQHGHSGDHHWAISKAIGNRSNKNSHDTGSPIQRDERSDCRQWNAQSPAKNRCERIDKSTGSIEYESA